MSKIVAIFGASYPKSDEPAYQLAYDTGRLLGELGYDIANGGYAGTMEASAKGAKFVGVSTIGVTCDIWSSKPNEWVDRVIHTKHLQDRLAKLVDIADGGYVVLPGSTGTLLELAMVWEMMFKKIMPTRPIVCVGGFYDPLIEIMAAERKKSADFISVVKSPDQLAGFFVGIK